MMNKKHSDSLKIGIVFMLIITVTVIVSMGIFIDSQNAKEIRNISTIYMEGASKQISNYFAKVIDLHLGQVQSMLHDANDTNLNADIEKLKHDAEIFNFDYLGIYYDDNSFEMIKGAAIELVEPEPFKESMHETGRKAAMATSPEGRNVVILGIAAAYEHDGKSSAALVAGYDADYFIDELSLNADSVIFNTTIIRADGSYVLRNSGEYKGNYFDNITNIYNNAGADADTILTPLRQSIAEERTYAGSLQLSGKEEYIYCTKIPDSEWYLVCFLPYGVLNETMESLNSINKFAEMFALACVIAAFVILQIVYSRVSHRQYAELQSAHRDALDAHKELQRLLEINEKLSVTDYLTHLPNRRGLDRYVESKWKDWIESNAEVTFITLDIDNLKVINDTYGHREGDWTISTFGRIVDNISSEYGITSRTGGDEFLSVLAADHSTAQQIEDSIYAKLDEVNSSGGKPYELHASIGCYTVPIDSRISYDECVRQSDNMMYKIKNEHRKLYKG